MATIEPREGKTLVELLTDLWRELRRSRTTDRDRTRYLRIVPGFDPDPAEVLRRTSWDLSREMEQTLYDLGPASIPFSPGAVKAMELAEKTARDFGHPEVVGAHLLLGLLLIEGSAQEALGSCGLSPGRMYGSLARLEPSRFRIPLLRPGGIAADLIVSEARHAAGSGDVTTLHLLASVLRHKRSFAVVFLEEQLVDVGRLRSRVAALVEAVAAGGGRPGREELSR